MTSRKAKEQQAATSNNSLNKDKNLLNAKFSELGTRLTQLEGKSNNVTKKHPPEAINAVATTAQEAVVCRDEKIEQK